MIVLRPGKRSIEGEAYTWNIMLPQKSIVAIWLKLWRNKVDNIINASINKEMLIFVSILYHALIAAVT